MASASNPNLAAALWYAKHGWRVFAAHTSTAAGCSCSKKHQCPDEGKHPRWDKKLLPHGVTSATTDESRIRAWWKKWPDANVGLATGTDSDVFVVDIDPRHGGVESLQALQVEHGPLPQTVEGVTGSGGSHFVLAHPGLPARIKNSDSEIASGFDIRGDGGYIIAPPSAHKSGASYRWKEGHSPKDLTPAPAPEWLLALIQKTGQRQDTPVPSDPIPEGQRNKTLFKNGCAMRRRGLSYEAILAALRIENEQRCQPPMDDEAVQKIADSASRYEPAIHNQETSTYDIPPEQRPTLDEAVATAQEVLATLKETPNARLLYKALDILCTLPADEWGPWKAEYKTVLGEQLNLRDLDRAYKEAKHRHWQASQPQPADASESDTRVKIQINERQLPAITADAFGAILAQHAKTPAHPLMYVRSGALQRVVADEDGHQIMELLTDAPLKGILARVAKWCSRHISLAGVTEEDEFPPLDVVKDLLHLGGWPGLPALHGIVHAPVFGADGTLHQTPGYNPATRLYQAGTFTLGDITPSSQNIAAAKQLVCKTWWGDFPFRDDASKAHALAVVITPFVREMIAGQIPLTIYDSPTPGTGKGLLADICAMPATGYPLPTMTAGRDPDVCRFLRW